MVCDDVILFPCVQVDGRSLQGYSNFQAVDLLRATGQTVQLTLERYLRGPKWEQLQQAIANHELKPPTPTSPSATSLPKYQLSTVCPFICLHLYLLLKPRQLLPISHIFYNLDCS